MEFKFFSTPLEEDLYNQNIIELHVVAHHESVEKSFLLNQVAYSKDLSTSSPCCSWWLVCYLSIKEMNLILNTVLSSFCIVKKKKNLFYK